MGIALLVYGRDDGIARQISDVETVWTGSGPGFMGNKGAVGVRFRVNESSGTAGETYTYEVSICSSIGFSHAFPFNLQFRQLPFDSA